MYTCVGLKQWMGPVINMSRKQTGCAPQFKVISPKANHYGSSHDLNLANHVELRNSCWISSNNLYCFKDGKRKPSPILIPKWNKTLIKYQNLKSMWFVRLDGYKSVQDSATLIRCMNLCWAYWGQLDKPNLGGIQRRPLILTVVWSVSTDYGIHYLN